MYVKFSNNVIRTQFPCEVSKKFSQKITPHIVSQAPEGVAEDRPQTGRRQRQSRSALKTSWAW
jgi:hypothetical protein